MLTGTVKWFDKQRGFGFILDQEGNEVFCHFSKILVEGFKYLEEGDVVEYEMDSNQTKPQADNVKIKHRKPDIKKLDTKLNDFFKSHDYRSGNELKAIVLSISEIMNIPHSLLLNQVKKTYERLNQDKNDN